MSLPDADRRLGRQPPRAYEVPSPQLLRGRSQSGAKGPDLPCDRMLEVISPSAPIENLIFVMARVEPMKIKDARWTNRPRLDVTHDLCQHFRALGWCRSRADIDARCQATTGPCSRAPTARRPAKVPCPFELARPDQTTVRRPSAKGSTGELAARYATTVSTRFVPVSTGLVPPVSVVNWSPPAAMKLFVAIR